MMLRSCFESHLDHPFFLDLQFLQDEVDGFYEAYKSDHELFYDTADIQLVYSTASEGEGSVIGGIHLELLVDLHPPADSANYSFWKVCEPPISILMIAHAVMYERIFDILVVEFEVFIILVELLS